jgi:hypothetical protein
MVSSVRKFMFSPGAKKAVLIAFLLSAGLFGAGSRADIQSLVVLRPLAALFIGYAAIVMIVEKNVRLNFVFWLLLSLAALMVIQLIPLPYSIWHSLPGRSVVIEISNTLGISQFARPISLSPSRTINSLFALLIPFAAILLTLIQAPKDRSFALKILLAICAFSGVLAVLQLFTPSSSFLYFYAVTNDGQAVGIFANRNHQALLLAISILLATWYFLRHRDSVLSQSIMPYFALISGCFFTLLVFLSGSRVGIILGLVAVALSSLAFFFDTRRAKAGSVAKKDGKRPAILLYSFMAAALPIFRFSCGDIPDFSANGQ